MLIALSEPSGPLDVLEAREPEVFGLMDATANEGFVCDPSGMAVIAIKAPVNMSFRIPYVIFVFLVRAADSAILVSASRKGTTFKYL